MKQMSLARKALIFGITLSLLLHFGGWWVSRGTEVPDFAFEFELPMEVELGMGEALIFDGTTEDLAGETSETSETPETSTEGSEGLAASADAGVADAGPADAGPRDAGPRDAGVDAGPEDAGEGDAEETSGEDGNEEEGSNEGQRIPPGAQLAVRMDMSAIRGSRLSAQVTRLLQAIPDWGYILEGSEVDPLADLDRLMIASPNLQRARFVMAGRHAHEDDGRGYIDLTVERMARAHGEAPRWREQDGVPVADWPNDDATRRVVAVVGPRHFVITRPQDLPRILAIAAARGQREASGDSEEASSGDNEGGSEGGTASEGTAGEGSEGASSESEGVAPAPTRADSLLSMEPGEALSFEAEGVHRFVARAPENRRPPIDRLPTRFRLGVRDVGDGVRLSITGHFPDAATAETALTFWLAERDRYASEMGFPVSGVLRSIQMEVRGQTIEAELQLSYLYASIALGQATAMLTNRRDARGSASQTPSAMSPSTMDEEAAAESP